MKKLNLILLAICNAFIGFAQQQPPFSNVSLDNIYERDILCFTISREVNVRHYRIEASNDNLNYEVIATLLSKGGSQLPTNYRYDLSGYSYKYYRIGMVKMNATMPYSAVVTAKGKASIPEQKIKRKSVTTTTEALAHQ